MRRTSLYAALPLLAVLLLSVGCGKQAPVGTPTVSPRQQFYNDYTAILKNLGAVYEEGTKALGRAKAEGTIGQENYDKGVATSRLVHQGLETAKSALLAYLKTDDEVTAKLAVEDAVDKVRKLIADLQSALRRKPDGDDDGGLVEADFDNGWRHLAPPIWNAAIARV